MIILSRSGALEFSTVEGRPGHFLVSAWVEGDIDRAFPGAEVQEVDPDLTEAKWRRYKAIVRKEAVFDYLAREASGINYDSVYKHLPDARHRVMLEDWQSLWAEDSFQRWKRRSS